MTDPHAELLALCKRYSMDVAHAGHVADLCDIIFTQTQHLHGLPKSFRRVVRATALFHDIAEADGKTRHDIRGSKRLEKISLHSVTAEQKKIMATAVSLHSRRSDIAGFLKTLARRGGPPNMAVAGRIAAILRIADGLDHARSQDAQIAAIHDDGDSLTILLAPLANAAENALFALGKADLWNALALRPIETIKVSATAKIRPMIEPGLTSAEAGRRIICRQFEYFLSRVYGLPYDRDPEFVHETRVADRRFRVAAGTFEDMLDGGLATMLKVMKELAGKLGMARDSDVLIGQLEEYAADAPKSHRKTLRLIISRQQKRQLNAHRKMLRAGHGSRIQKRLRDFHRTLMLPVNSAGGLQICSPVGKEPMAAHAGRIIETQLAKTLRRRTSLKDLSTAGQHRLRIRFKKLRYISEFFRELYADGLESIIAPATRMQRLLGTVHDLAAYSRQVEELFDPMPPGGRKVRNRLIATMERRGLSALRKAAVAWKKFIATGYQAGTAASTGTPARKGKSHERK